MKKINLHTQVGMFTHYFPGGVPVAQTVERQYSDGLVNIIDGHPEVVKLWDAWRLFKGQVPLELELEIMETAIELLRPDILFATISSGIVCDSTVDLLFDSLKLGLCPNHERKTSVALLHRLTEPHEPGSRKRPAVKCYEVPCEIDPDTKCTDRDFVFTWASKTDGLRDLITTMHTLYVGKSR